MENDGNMMKKNDGKKWWDKMMEQYGTVMANEWKWWKHNEKNMKNDETLMER